MEMEQRRKRHLSDGDQLEGNKRPLLVISSHVPVPSNSNPTGTEGGAVGHGLLEPADGQQPAQEQAVEQVHLIHHHSPPSPPESQHQESSDEDDEFDADQEEEEDPVMAGYEYCSKEAIRFLLEEEKLSADHPVIRSLLLHLEAGRNNVGVGGGPSSSFI